MQYAIELFFDLKTEKQIHDIFLELRRKKINSYMLRRGSHPHITLFVFKKFDRRKTFRALEKFAAETHSFPIRFIKTGVFKEIGAFYLLPHQNNLFSIQKQCAKHIKRCLKNMEEHYLPKNVIFHCTLGINLNPQQIKRAVQLLKKKQFPKKPRITKVVLISFSKNQNLKIRELFSSPLG